MLIRRTGQAWAMPAADKKDAEINASAIRDFLGAPDLAAIYYRAPRLATRSQNHETSFAAGDGYHRSQSSSASRFTAGASGFFDGGARRGNASRSTASAINWSGLVHELIERRFVPPYPRGRQCDFRAA